MAVTFLRMVRELHLFAQVFTSTTEGNIGRAWEMFVDAYLARRGLPVESSPGGYRLFGHVPVSGLTHQIDSGIGCRDALVVAEWKAHRRFPKNELLRFKAASDDYVIALHSDPPASPLYRVFGGPGEASGELRAYAALHGICVIERGLWPAPVVASPIWEAVGGDGPSIEDRARLSWLVRPIQAVLIRRANGYLIPAPPGSQAIRSLVDLHQFWSARLWEAIDGSERVFEQTLVDAGAIRRSA